MYQGDKFANLNKAVLCYSEKDKKTGIRTHTLETIYMYYRAKFKQLNIDLATFRLICTTYNTLVCDTIVTEGSEITTAIGGLRIKKTKTITHPNYYIQPKLRIDFKNGTKDKPCYHFNFHSNGYYYKLVLVKNLYIKNIKSYYIDTGNYLTRLITTNALNNTVICT